MEKYNRILSFFLFITLAIVITYPLAKPGYILTLDAVITPKVAFAPLTSSSFIYQNILAVLNFFMPSYWIERIILFLIFFLSGWGMYRFAGKNLRFARYFAGIFYAINPFVYERVMAGHWQLLLGYSIFPFVVASVINYFHDTTKKNTILLALIATLLFNIAIHYLLIFIVFFIAMGVINAYLDQHNKEKLTKITRQTIYFIIITFILNANWIISSVLGISDISQSIKQFTRGDLISFQSVADAHFGLVFNLLSGYGFWPEAYDYFILPKDIMIFWPLLSVVIIAVSIYGLIQIFREKEKPVFPLAITMMVIFILALDFAGGIALKSFSNLVITLYEIFPPLRGFREPQKLVGFLMFCYAYLGGIGLYHILETIKTGRKYIIFAIFLILPFIYTPTVFGGFWGQLKPVWYPQSWSEANKFISKDKGDFITLFFPWHQYMRFKFANNMVVTNPAPHYFSKPILSSQNYETVSLYTHDSRFEALHVEGLLSIEKEGVNLLGENVYEKQSWGEALSPIDVKYIILAKEDDWKSYRFLERSLDLENIFESDDLILYKNNKWSENSINEPEPQEEYTKEEIKNLDEN